MRRLLPVRAISPLRRRFRRHVLKDHPKEQQVQTVLRWHYECLGNVLENIAERPDVDILYLVVQAIALHFDFHDAITIHMHGPVLFSLKDAF
jgi:hypothetical protein